MKNKITYILIFIVSFVYSYETIKYFSKSIDNSIVWIDDADCEEKNSESEKSKEKNEKSNFSEDWYHNNKHANHTLISDNTETGSLGSKQNNNFSSSDYRQEVYSPPEIL